MRTIIDVRTVDEFKLSNAIGSINIPLQEIPQKIEEIKKLQSPIILCCASGMRSGMALNILKENGIECENAGSWTNI